MGGIELKSFSKTRNGLTLAKIIITEINNSFDNQNKYRTLSLSVIIPLLFSDNNFKVFLQLLQLN